MLTVPRGSTNNRIYLATDAVDGTFDVTLGLCGIILGLALGVLLFAGRGPGLGAGQVTDSLDHCPFDGVVLAGDFAANREEMEDVSDRGREEGAIESAKYLGWSVLAE